MRPAVRTPSWPRLSSDPGYERATQRDGKPIQVLLDLQMLSAATIRDLTGQDCESHITPRTKLRRKMAGVTTV